MNPSEWAGKIVQTVFSEDARNIGFDVLSSTKYSIEKEAENLLELYTSYLNT